MSLVWNPRLSTGLEWQDIQHQELFNRVNVLLDAIMKEPGTSSLGDIFSFLEDYVLKHFGNEERFMKAQHMPNFEAHHAAHADFVRQYFALKDEFVKSEGTSETVCLKLQTMLCDWLIDHIGGMDRELTLQTAEMNRR
ncbi:MAG TPA: bacteriohemerythrin [bacterium]|jgi:hemerythrin